MGLVKLYKNVPLRANSGRTINFPNGNKNSQETFFNRYLFDTDEDGDGEVGFKWIRENEEIRVALNYGDTLDINYLMFKNDYPNSDVVNVNIYCFVTGRRWLSDGTTALSIQVDVLQTYMFDYELKESYIEREHQARAKLVQGGIERRFNVEAEGLELGSQMRITKTKNLKAEDDLLFKNVQTECAVLICRDFMFEDEGMVGVTKYKVKNIQTPFVVYLVHNSSIGGSGGDTYYNLVRGRATIKTGTNSWSISTANVAIMSALSNKILTDDRVVAYIPLRALPFRTKTGSVPAYHYDLLNLDNAVVSLVRGFKAEASLPDRYVIRIDSNTEINLANLSAEDFDGVSFVRTGKTTPHKRANESKLLVSPFSQYFIMNNYANRKELYRNFRSGDDELNGILYNQIFSSDYAETIYISNYDEPNALFIDTSRVSLPLANDAYLNYMRNTQASRTAGLLVPIATTALGIVATGLGGGAVGVPLIMGGVTSIGGLIANQEAKKQDLKNQPDSIRNAQGNTLLDLSTGFNTIMFQKLEIMINAKERVYDFLRTYGYKCGEIKTPSINSRYHYNYIKTIGADIRPKASVVNKAINSEVLLEIANIYDLGLLIWHYRGDTTIEPFTMEYENIETELLIP